MVKKCSITCISFQAPSNELWTVPRTSIVSVEHCSTLFSWVVMGSTGEESHSGGAVRLDIDAAGRRSRTPCEYPCSLGHSLFGRGDSRKRSLRCDPRSHWTANVGGDQCVAKETAVRGERVFPGCVLLCSAHFQICTTNWRKRI